MLGGDHVVWPRCAAPEQCIGGLGERVLVVWALSLLSPVIDSILESLAKDQASGGNDDGYEGGID